MRFEGFITLLRPAAGLLLLAVADPSGAQDRSPAQPIWLTQQVRTTAPRTLRRAAHVRPQAATTERTAPASSASTASKPSFVVAVFGDTLALSIARGLNDAQDRGQVFDATSESNGLTEDSVADWTTSIGAVMADTGRIDAAAIMLGSADLKPLTTDAGTREAFGTPAWRAAYGDRVQRLAETFRDKHVPLIWVGLPVVRDDTQASRFADLNAIARDRAQAGGAVYIDSWEAFVDDGGQYSITGPDVNGQTAKLRRNDGVGFTQAGADKLASFVEVELKPLRDRAEATRRLAAVTLDEDDVFDQALQIDVNAQIRREAGLDAAPAAERIGAVVLLTAPPVAPGGQLATLDGVAAPTGPVAAALVKGLTPAPQRGRTDDFSWPKP